MEIFDLKIPHLDPTMHQTGHGQVVELMLPQLLAVELRRNDVIRKTKRVKGELVTSVDEQGTVLMHHQYAILPPFYRHFTAILTVI